MKRFDHIKRILEEQATRSAKGVYKTASATSKLNWLRIQQNIMEVSDNIPKGSKVLDIGCGRGHNTLMLKIIRPDINIIGVNPEKDKIWEKFERKGCRFQVGNGLNLNFDDNTFDVVVSFGVLEHIRENFERMNKKSGEEDMDIKFMKEINRVLKKNGKNIILNLPNKYSWSEFITKILKLKYHIIRYNKKQIKILASRSNFKVIKIKREFFIPAQIYKLSKKVLFWFNKHYKFFNKLDKIFNKTPLNIFSQSYFVVCKKI